MNPPVTHILFDLDGLLLSTETIYTNVLTEFMTEYGKTFTYEAKRKIMGRRSEDVARLMIAEYDLPITIEEFMLGVRSRLPPEIWCQADLLPGADELINYFCSHFIPMAIATSSNQFQIDAKLANHKEIWAKMHHIVVAGGDPEVSQLIISGVQIVSNVELETDNYIM